MKKIKWMSLLLFNTTVLISPLLCFNQKQENAIINNNYNKKKELISLEDAIHNAKVVNENKVIKFHVKNSVNGVEEWVANAGYGYQKWSLKEHEAYSGINNIDINWENINKKINSLKLNYFGEPLIKDLLLHQNLVNKTKIDVGLSLKDHQRLSYQYEWKTTIKGELSQKAIAKNQIGGSYYFNKLASTSSTNANKFYQHCIGGINGLHTHEGGWAMAGSHHNFSLRNNHLNSEVFSIQEYDINIFNDANVTAIIDTFTNFNFPLSANLDNQSGIWNKEALEQHNYFKVLSFSKLFNDLKKIKDYYDQGFDNFEDINLLEIINDLKASNIIDNHQDEYGIKELVNLYERILLFFGSNKIGININNKDYWLWDGMKFNDEFDFYNTPNYSNELYLQLSDFRIENITNQYGVISPNTTIPIPDHYKYLKLNYRNNFQEVNEINVERNQDSHSFKIPNINGDVLQLVQTNQNMISYLDDDVMIMIKNELNKKTNDLIDNIELFNFKIHNNQFTNLEEVLQLFKINDQREYININPSTTNNFDDDLFSKGLLNKDDGLIYFIIEINHWNNFEKNHQLYEGNFLKSAKEKFISKMNSDHLVIKELFLNEINSKGYFLLKANINPSYIKNINDYKLILENYNNIFHEELIKTYNDSFFFKKTEKELNLKIKNEFFLDENNHHLFYDLNENQIKTLKPIWSLIQNNANIFFQYENLIFNENNIKYQSDVKEELDLLNNEINILEKGLNEKTHDEIYFRYENLLLILLPIFLLSGLIPLVYYMKKRRTKA
ncbi:MAG: hypothetical protein ACRCVI_02475 [Mycoplasmoidaceae bacterium]